MKKAIIKWLFGNDLEEYWELHDKYCKELNAHIESLEENQMLRLELMKKIENNIKIGIEDMRTLIGALKVKSVFDRDYLSCKCVRKDPNNGEIITFDSDGLFSLTWIDDMIHNGETYIISRDGTIFDSCVEELINNLKK